MKRSHRKMQRRRSGFTLFEVLLVLVILVVLTSTVGIYLNNAQKKAYVRAAQTQIGLFTNMLKDYHIDVGAYPTTEQGLGALRVKPDGATKWLGPYAEKDIPVDPWNQPYQYQSSGDDYRIWSLGPDMQDGTGDEITN